MGKHDWPKSLVVAGVKQTYYVGSRGMTVDLEFEGTVKFVTVPAKDVANLVELAGQSKSPCVEILRAAKAHFDDIAEREAAVRAIVDET